MHVRLRAALALVSVFLLSGCLGHRVKVLDAYRSRVGTVRIRSDALAIVYTMQRRSRIGVMEDGIITGVEGDAIGKVDENGLIRNTYGQLLGKFGNKKLCLSLYDEVLGFTEEDVAPKPGGAACLLLFLAKQPL